MTGPDDVTREQPAVEPTVSTAPPPARPHRWWSVIPKHLGKARTSTLVIALLFLAIGTLYLNVRPDPEGTRTTGGDSDVTEPATTTDGGTTAPSDTETTPAPTTDVEPTTTDETTAVPEPTEDTLPEETVPEETESVPPSTEETVPPAPTTSAPPG